MVIKTLMAMVVPLFLQTAPSDASATLHHVQSKERFLGNKQIRLLLTDTQVSHSPPGGGGTAYLHFHADGEVRMHTPNGKSRSGSWRIKGRGIVCLSNVGGMRDKSFCARLTREGDEIHHFVPKTGKRMKAQPWVITAPGPKTGLVPSG